MKQIIEVSIILGLIIVYILGFKFFFSIGYTLITCVTILWIILIGICAFDFISDRLQMKFDEQAMNKYHQNKE